MTRVHCTKLTRENLIHTQIEDLLDDILKNENQEAEEDYDQLLVDAGTYIQPVVQGQPFYDYSEDTTVEVDGSEEEEGNNRKSILREEASVAFSEVVIQEKESQGQWENNTTAQEEGVRLRGEYLVICGE